MVRAILAGFVGYLVMVLFVIVGMTVGYLALGEDRVFQPGVFDITPLWGGVVVGVGLLAAVVGGLVCALVMRPGSKAPLGLAVFVLLMGVVTAGLVVVSDRDAPGPRTEPVAVFEAANVAQQPTWTLIANPILGVVGTLLGAGLTGRCKGAGKGAAKQTADA